MTSRWLIVALCFVTLSLVSSARASLGLAMPDWERELGWARSLPSAAGALMLIVMAVSAPLCGILVDRHGARSLVAGGLLLAAAGAALVAAMAAPWQLALAFGLLIALGSSAAGGNVVVALVMRNFSERAGLATGIASAGGTAGQLAVVPLVAAVLAASGWRDAFAMLAAAMLALAVAAWLLYPPDVRRAAGPSDGGGGLRHLAGSGVFHALFWSFTLCGFTTAGIIETHLMPYTTFCGFPPLQSATAYGLLSAFNMAGMVASGYLADKVDRPRLLAGLYFARALTYPLLLQVIGDYPLLLLFSVAFGLVDYATMPLTASLAASHFGVRRVGLAMGLIFAGHSMGGAAGAMAGGMLFDSFARYQDLWLSGVAISALAGVIVLTVREPRRGAMAEPQPA